ncbi:hypothetical protein N2601_31390 (plasmid) [Rhizobium sp. CB3060]|uniref:hypothetical protein n=1 Tax=Rhizobium sp. CB3060 TaxID=3138255 RepID=UPI0021A57FAE|nr:hypothetical protein [Rhizobium tropici]UWU25488.1 hypothetical protein N2601_31390 [Rhizobium tropici]
MGSKSAFRPTMVEANKVMGDPICTGFMNLRVVTKPNTKGALVQFDDGAEDAITTAELEKLIGGRAISMRKAPG